MKKQLCTSLASLMLPLASYGGITSPGYYQRNTARPGFAEPAMPGGVQLAGALAVKESTKVENSADLGIVQGSQVRELLIIDEAVPDKATFYRALKSGVAVAEISAGDDGLKQLRTILADHQNLDAVHIVSHAEDGEVHLGSSRVTADSVKADIDLFAALNGSVKAGGDLLFYGCNLAATEQGEELLDIIAGNTQIDVAASNDLTGSDVLGGDWDLEIATGDIEATAFSAHAVKDFRAVLAPTTITFPNPGSLGESYSGVQHSGYDFYLVSPPSEPGLVSQTNFNCEGGELFAGYFDYFGDPVSKFYVKPVDDSAFSISNINVKGLYTVTSGSGPSSTNTITVTAYKSGSPVVGGSVSASGVYMSDTLVDLSGNAAFGDVDKIRIEPDGGSLCLNSLTVDDPVPSTDSDGGLTAAGGVTEPVSLDTTIDTVGEAVDVFDFTLADGGTSDGLAMAVSEVRVNVTGTSTNAERSNIIWRLDGLDASNVTGTYNAATNTITFSSLSVSIANGGNETYIVNAYYNDNTNLTEDHTIILSVDGDTDLTVGGSGTQMGATSAVSNGSGTTVDVVASQLAFTTQPSDSTSGSAMSTQPVVIAQDAFGNTDVDFTETVTLTEASAGSLSNNTQASVNGVAAFTGLTYTATADQQSFTLTANDQDGVGSNLATVDANAVTSDVVATQLQFMTQPAPTTVNSGNATSFTTVPVVSATDANDIVDTGYSTDITLAEINGAGNATMNAVGDTDGNASTVSITPSSGAATFTGMQITYTNIGASETFNLRAASGGLTIADSAQFTSVSTPVVTDGNVSISGATGIGGAFKVGDTVTATWNNTAGGDNNPGITGATVDFSAFGGGAAVAATNSSDTWTATYTIVSGAIDGTSGNVSVTATNAAGDTTTADTSNATVDNIAPTVTAANISVSGATGTGGIFRIGDTVTATWNNTAGGDNNSDTISTATVDFSQFGGGTAVSATNSSGTWTATYTITSGAIDASNRNASVTVSDNAGNTSSASDTSNVSVDNVAPTVTDGTISLSGASGDGGVFIAGDTVTATWNNTASGDNNGDTLNSVTVDFSAFGGSVALAATESSDTWTATYTLPAGALTAGNLNVAATVMDNAGNATTTADTSNATVDTQAPAISSVAVPANATYVAGQNLDFTVSASENITVDTGGGTPRLVLIIGSTNVYASYISGSGTSAMTFRYTLQQGDLDSNGIAVGTLEANGGTLRDGSGNSLNQTLNSVGSTAAVLVDAVEPTVSSVAVPADGRYVAGENLNFTVSTSENVTVNTGGGTPRLTLAIGSGTRSASYLSGSGTSALIFSYTVQAGDEDTDGISLATTLDANGGTLKDSVGNDVNSALSAVGDTTGVLVDAVAPSGHTVSFDDDTLNSSDAQSASFSFNNAEIDADYSYTISSSDGGTPVTGVGTVSSASEQISGLDLRGLSDGTLTLSVTLTDSAGNAASALTDTATLDATATSIGLTTSAEVLVNAAFDVTIQFDEAVDGFTEDDLVVSNATLSGFAGSGASYSVIVTPTSDGAVTVDVGAGVAQDAAGNDNTAATQLTRDYDGTAPTPVLASNVTADVTNAPIELTVDFGETVIGFVSGDLSITNGSVAGFADVGNGVFELTVEATGDGDVTLGVSAAVAEDEAGNDNEASELLTVAFDGSGPALQGSVPAVEANGVPYQSDLALTFDEPVFVGSGDLVVQDATDGVEHTRLPITDSRVSINEAQVTVVLDDALVPTHEYYVTFAANSLEDEAGNGWAGIVNDADFRFTVGNQAPEADNDSATLDQGARRALDVLANDTDEEGRLNSASVRVITQPAHGRASVETSTGAVSYEPEADYTGPDSFTYVVEDEFGGESNVATVSLNVEAAGLPPVTRGDVATLLPGGSVTLALLNNDRAGASGVALDPQSAELVLRPHHGTAQWANGELTYTADNGFEGVESLAYTVADANGVRSAVTHLFINVSDGAVAPIARDDSADTEMAAEVALDVLANDEATGGALASGTIELGSLPRHGVAEVDPATGAIAYTPDADYRGEDVFHYTVRDDRGLVSGSARVTINVGLAGVPVAGNDQVQAMDGATLAINVLGNDRGLDVALNPATLSVVDSPAQGLVTLDAGAGVFRYTPDDAFDGADTFTYTVQDENGQVSAPATVTVTAQPGNNQPLANDLALTVAEDSDTSVSPLTNDQDLNGTLDTASLQVAQQPLNGSLSIGANGTVSYTPGENFYGEDRFTYTVADDTGRTSRLAVVRLVVAPVPDEPLISGSPTSTVSVGNAYRFTPVATDIDGNPLTFSVANLPAWATFDVQNGRISGTPELDDVGSYGDIVISVSNGDESSELAAFSVRVTDNSGGSDDGGQGEPESPVAPGSDEGADIPVVDPNNPAVEVGNDQWPFYTDDQPSKARYETTFVDAAGEKRSVSVTLDDPQAPLPATESPDASGRQTLTFSQTDGSEQTVAVSPSGETTIAVFGQAGDADPASLLTSDAAELDVTALAGGDMLSKVVIDNSDGGHAEMTVVQSVTDGVLVSGTRYSADGDVLETTAVRFDMVPADIELAADGTVSLKGEATSGSETTAVEYRVTPDGTVSAVSQYVDGISTPVSSGVTVRQGGSVGMVLADGDIALDQPYPGGGAEHQVTVTSDGQVEHVDRDNIATNLPAGSILVIDGDEASTGGRDLDPDGNGLNRAGEITGSTGGQPTISRLEVTDVSNGNESVFVSPAADGDGVNASRSLSEGELSARIRLDGTSAHRLSGRDGIRDNQARSLIPGSLSLFFNDRVVTVADEADATLLTELLVNGEVRHEVAAGGESTRAFSYLPGSSTVMERDGNGGARVVTRAAANGRSLEATANADGSANHRLINRLGERSEADIRVPGAFTSLNEDGNLRSRVRLEGSDVCAWVETFGNGQTGTGFGTYDPATLTCRSVEQPTSLNSLFEAGNSVDVESDAGNHIITIETRVTRPIRF